MSLKQNPDITILCRVVDNFGDIGVVYRLARALTELDCNNLRIIVDNLDSFSLIAPGIDTNADIQLYNSWTIIRWNEQKSGTAQYDDAVRLFTERPPQVIIECFACGRPDWLENILFVPGRTDIVHIINLEYLTAEPYADEFHKLQSLTRSSKVQKVNFMPGFTPQTGGLILDEQFMSALKSRLLEENLSGVTGESSGAQAELTSKKTELNSTQIELIGEQTVLASEKSVSTGIFPVVVFSYERDFTAVVESMKHSLARVASLQNKTLTVYAASGKSWIPFYTAWKVAGKPFPVVELPFMAQKEWDELLCKAKFLFIRGEDSLSRACLTGVPFVWHAYPQSDDYQLVKVRALLERMKPFFNADDFDVLSAYWLFYNGDKSTTTCDYEARLLSNLFERYGKLQQGFADFSEILKKNGNLASHLMTFISEMV